jgi:PAS domain S-box-containing protein
MVSPAAGSLPKGNTASTEQTTTHILYVDNEAGLLKAAKPILEMQGSFHVETASSVEEALKKMREKTFDVIVCDYIMPGKDGLEFLKELRDSGNSIPFIIFTGKGRETVAIEALNVGADQYINKIGRTEAVYSELAHGIRTVVKSKKAEKALQESEEKYRKQFEAAMDAIFLADAETGKLVDCNRAATKLVGRKKSELIGKYQRILHPPETIECGFSRTFRQHVTEKEGEVLEEQVITKSGEIRDVIINATTFELEGKKLIQGTFHDITEHKKTDEKLKENEKKYRLLTENITDVIYIQDMNLNVTYASPSVKKLSGYTPEELLKLRPEKFMTPESFERGVADFKNAITSAMEEPEYEIPLKQYEYIRKDGSTFWGELKIKPLRDANNNLVGFQGTLRDITERKEAEKKLDEMMNELVTINEKLGVVGRLTRHDARNKLSIIANNVYLAKHKLPADHAASEFLGDVESAVDQIEKIFDFARNYEMLGVEDLSYMDVGKSVEEAAILHSGMNGVKLVNECKGLMVMADSLLRQLFYNLVDNTLKYGETASQIRVYYEEGEDQLKLVYEDDGVGIPENEKENLFREGYGKSTGYGLYLIKKMCEEYGWVVRETGKQGRGAQFTMTIPETARNGKKSYRIN